MMMMMRGFVERVINSPQTRCRSAKQVDLQMSSKANIRGERVAVRRAAGKLFQMTGPATVKLLIPSVVIFLGTVQIASSASGPKMSLAGDGGDCQTVVSQVCRR